MIPRKAITEALNRALARSPVVVLVGPRQSGKTTLARLLVGDAAGARAAEEGHNGPVAEATPERGVGASAPPAPP